MHVKSAQCICTHSVVLQISTLSLGGRSEMAPTRWGIAGAGMISCDFTAALQMLPQDEHQVAAVGARSLPRAQEFAKRFNISTAYGSYQELANDPTIDVVYVATVHPAHFAVSKMMMDAGKHVLCEKPLTMNARQTQQLLAVADTNGVFLLEGFWSRFFPVYADLRHELAIGTIGEPCMVTVNFGFDFSPRISRLERWYGGMMDMGCYGVQFALLVFGGELPHKVVASGILENGSDKASFVTLYFSNNRVAQLNTHCGLELDGRATIFGTKGKIEVPKFWIPEKLITPNKTYDHPIPKCPVPMTLESDGFIYEAEAVRHSILKGEKENPLHPHEDSIKVAKIMDEIRRQLGVVFDEDE